MQINQIFIHAYSLSQMSIIHNVHWLNNTLYLSEKLVFGCVEQKDFHGRVLSIRVFSSDGHYGLIVSPRMNTIASRDRFKPIRIGENLLVNYDCEFTAAVGK